MASHYHYSIHVNNLAQRKKLPSGHEIGFAQYGPALGRPVLFFHGFAGSRLQIPPSDELAYRYNLRIIAVDRPGTGLTTPRPGLTLLGWASDVAQLADDLDIKKFGIIAWSAGGPHALACAYKYPDRVTRLALAAPMGRWFVGPGASQHASSQSKTLAVLGRYAPWLLQLSVGSIQRQVMNSPQRTIDKQLSQLPAPDQLTLRQNLNYQLLVGTIGEGFRQGSIGLSSDVMRTAMPWGFEVEGITAPATIWQGAIDDVVLPALTQELAGRMKTVDYRLLPEEGHFALFTHWAEILSSSE
jgi:pimeloyl-ACP methyl ester carboxylesterase